MAINRSLFRITGAVWVKNEEGTVLFAPSLSSSEVSLLSARGGMNKKCFSRLKWAIDICEVVKAKMRTITEFYKLNKQILQSLILPSVMCQNHSATEILPVIEVHKSKYRSSGGLASNTPRHYSAGYLARNFFKSHFF